MKDFLDKFKKQIPDLTDLVAVMGTLINISINKLFRQETPANVQDFDKNKQVESVAVIASSYVNLNASILTLITAYKTFTKGADRNTAIVQDIAGQRQLKKVFTLEEKKAWFDNIILDLDLKLDSNAKEAIIKTTPWDLIDNKTQLIDSLTVKNKEYVDKLLEELLVKRQQLEQEIESANNIINKILTTIDSIIRN